MRQLTLSHGLRLCKARRESGVDALLNILDAEEDLHFHAIIPQGSILKSIAELLVRCAPLTSAIVDGEGVTFIGCDASSGRLIHVRLLAADMTQFRFLGQTTLRSTLESSSLHAVFHQLKRRDQVVLYATRSGQFGSLVDYSGRQDHTKHSTICVKHAGQCTEYVIPEDYHTEGVEVPSNILQRILRPGMFPRLGKPSDAESTRTFPSASF